MFLRLILQIWYSNRIWQVKQKFITMQNSKILVPTDLTELSEIATEYAVDLAHQLKIKEVILLNILIPAHVQTSYAANTEINSSMHIAEQLNLALMEKHKQIVEKHAKKYSTPEVSVTPVVETSTNRSDLNGYVKDYGAGLIVTGSKDKFSFLEILFGSDTEARIRKIDYPMIVLTGEPVPSVIQKIALAIDVELKDTEQNGIESVIDIADTLHAHLQLVYVITNGSIRATEAIDRLQKIAQSHQIHDYSINVVENHNLEAGLSGFARKYSPDIVAVITHGKGKIHDLIYGSNTGELIKQMEIPVLVSKCRE